MKKYDGRIPPCGIYCGGCSKYKNGKKNACDGAETGCRKCKTIYVCCVEKKGLDYCHECDAFPCSRFKKFAVAWEKYQENLIENQKIISEQGIKSLHNYYLRKVKGELRKTYKE